MAAPNAAMFFALGAASFVIILLVNSLVLWWVVSKIFKLHNTKFKTAFVTALVTVVIAVMINFVLDPILNFLARGPLPGATTSLFELTLGSAVTVAVNSLMVKKFYKLEMGKSFRIGLVWMIATAIVGLILGPVMFVISLVINPTWR